MDLSDEIIDLILTNYMEFNEVLKLRLVSTRWRNMVEDFYSRTKSVALIRADTNLESISNLQASANYRLFNAVKIESFLQIRLMKSPADALDCNLKSLLLRLFPNVERLACLFTVPMDLPTATNLTFLMYRWKNISTLSLVILAYPRQILIASAINRLKKLTRLDLGRKMHISLLRPTLARIQHLSLGFWLTAEELVRLFFEIGPHCCRLWVEFMFMDINVPVVMSWVRANEDLFSRITHFGSSTIITVANDAQEYIDRYFSSLRSLYIARDGTSMFARIISRISRLQELHIVQASALIPRNISLEKGARPMENVHTFEFRLDCPFQSEEGKDVETFCTQLAWLLPNVRHLILVFEDMDTVEMVKQNLFMFQNLRRYEVRQRTK